MFGIFKQIDPARLYDIMQDRVKQPVLDVKDKMSSQLFFVRVSPAEDHAFVRNEGGWIRNDIDLLLNMEDQIVASHIFGKLQEIESHGYSADENPDVIRLGLMSKYQQTESEVTAWLEDQIDRKMIEDERLALERNGELSVKERKERLQAFKDSLNSEERDIWLTSKRDKLRAKMLDEDDELNND